MRKLIAQELMSVDGFFAGPNGEIDWHRVDDEYAVYAKTFLESVDTLLFGRVTYQLMASFWPAETNDIAFKMNTLPKIVFSTTLSGVSWQNTKLVKENTVEVIGALKNQPGMDMAILGSAELCTYAMKAGLIDELHITVVPIVLGKGKPLFKDFQETANLKLLQSRPLRSGCVQLFYRLDS